MFIEILPSSIEPCLGVENELPTTKVLPYSWAECFP